MKKGLLIMALILAMILILTLFSGNKAEAYYGSYGYSQPYFNYGYSQPYVGYGYSAFGGGFYSSYGGYGGLYGYAMDIVGTEGGIIIVPARVGEPSPPVLGTGSGGLPPVSNPPQNPTQPGPVSIFPPPMPIMGTGPITYPGSIIYPQPGTMPALGTSPIPYPVYPTGPGRFWPDFPAMPSSSPMFPQTPAFPTNPYWPNVYPPIPYPTSPGSIPIPR